MDVLLADDHGVVCHGLCTLLESESGIDVVGVAADGLEALEKVEQLKPEVMVLDLMMPGLGGIDVLRQANGDRPIRKSWRTPCTPPGRMWPKR